jgi:hypothetical protein
MNPKNRQKLILLVGYYGSLAALCRELDMPRRTIEKWISGDAIPQRSGVAMIRQQVEIIGLKKMIKDLEKAELAKAKQDKLFITEILNDMHRNGYIHGGKAETMLRDWAKELRENARNVLPASRLRKIHAKEVGAANW